MEGSGGKDGGVKGGGGRDVGVEDSEGGGGGKWGGGEWRMVEGEREWGGGMVEGRIMYNTIQNKYEYYYSVINSVE